MKKILFISHDTSRSGAPIVLLYFLRWLKANTNIQIDILLFFNGDLRESFEEVGNTFTIAELIGEYSVAGRIKKAVKGVNDEKKRIDLAYEKLHKNEYDLIWGNTIITLPWLLKFKDAGNYKCVNAIHELTYAIGFFYDDAYVMNSLPKLDLILAGSGAVAENLVHTYHVPKENVRIVHAFIETDFTLRTSADMLRKELGISPDTFIIGGAGAPDIRKGLDLIPQFVARLKNTYPALNFQFIWLGGKSSDPIIRSAKLDAKKLGVEEYILFIEHTAFPNDYINLYDVFVLLSREDPFPLVTITAAYLQKVILAFENSGGAQELLGDGAGYLIPYLDLERMAAKVNELYANPDLGKKVGITAKKNVTEKYSPAIIPPMIFKLLNGI